MKRLSLDSRKLPVAEYRSIVRFINREGGGRSYEEIEKLPTRYFTSEVR